jgi:threonine aldolase
VIAAIAACNTGLALPYGHDELSQRLERKVSDIFEREVSVFLVSTGSAANALSLATLTPPWGSVLSHAEAHINRDECGAPEFYWIGMPRGTPWPAYGRRPFRQCTRRPGLLAG